MKFAVACILFALFGMAMMAEQICMITVDDQTEFKKIAKTLRTSICNAAKTSYTNLVSQLNGEVTKAVAAGWSSENLEPLLAALTGVYSELSTTNRMINEAK